jgi:hypothetical protein
MPTGVQIRQRTTKQFCQRFRIIPNPEQPIGDVFYDETGSPNKCLQSPTEHLFTYFEIIVVLETKHTLLYASFSVFGSESNMDLNEEAGLQIELSSESDEDLSSNFDKSSTTGTGDDGQARSNESGPEEHIARGETKAVNRSKWVVYFVIMLAAIGMGACAFTFTKRSEEQKYLSEVSKSYLELL